MTPDIRSTLIEFITTEAATPTKTTSQTDLIETELLDSLMLMDLVMFVEQTWGVSLMGHDFSPAHFRTVEKLGELIESRRLYKSA